MLCTFLLCILILCVLSFMLLFFFFSSRRRHTRCLSDWSSDVCSSDPERMVYGLCGIEDLEREGLLGNLQRILVRDQRIRGEQQRWNERERTKQSHDK